MILMIDNYDSFTYNLYQYIGVLNPDIEVYRNDRIDGEAVLAKKPTHIIISPGPKYPEEAGNSIDVIQKARGSHIPVLGVCLGHQAIVSALGGKIKLAAQVFHGKQDIIHIDNECPLFHGFEGTVKAGRYHSLIAEKESLPPGMCITATSTAGEIMGVSFENLYGIQFHPESILTERGMDIIQNFLNINLGINK